MDPEIFYSWAGYLCNPLRAANIQIETLPDKADAFRAEYRRLTGEYLRLTKDKDEDTTPFYILKPGADKRSVQQRVYFRGEKGATPDTGGGVIKICKTRSKGKSRINKKEFVTELFRTGFLIGKNIGNQGRIRARVPIEFAEAFDRGYDIGDPREWLNRVVRKCCAETGMRTFSTKDLRRFSSHSESELARELEALASHGGVIKNKSGEIYTLPFLVLDGELSLPSVHKAIIGESHPEKREYLIETYARNRGWVALAKKTFGEKCMYDNCDNAFIKEDGRPYIEAHHITPLHEGGEDGIWNLSVLCAHHHRMAHFAHRSQRRDLKKFLLQKNRHLRVRQ